MHSEVLKDWLAGRGILGHDFIFLNIFLAPTWAEIQAAQNSEAPPGKGIVPTSEFQFGSALDCMEGATMTNHFFEIVLGTSVFHDF